MYEDIVWHMKPDKKKAIYLAKREIPTLIYDAVNLEGINFTLPEVQTLLDGVTVGGHKVSEQQVVLNQNHAWQELINLIQNKTFNLNIDTACKLHKLAANQDALAWGRFRDKEVTITGTNYLPPKALQLENLFNNMIEKANSITDIYDKAVYVFLEMSCNQFFYDVNKRMGRFIMNGILLQAGYPIINVEAKRKLEFNTLMLDFYESNNQAPMNKFMRSCLKKEHIKFMDGIIHEIKNTNISFDK